MLWFEQGWYGRDGWVLPGDVVCHARLESAKDQILGVGTLGQHVPPHVRYGTTCLLIRYAIVCVSCSVEWRCQHTL
jgi:hypothetical protein